MSLLFLDSFDHYDTELTKWDYRGDVSIRLNTGDSRTGIGCLEINSGATGVTKTFDHHVTDIMVATAWYSTDNGLMLAVSTSDSSPQQGECVILECNADRSVQVKRGPGGGSQILGVSAPGLITFSSYNQVAFRTTISLTATVHVWINGVEVLTLTNVNTTNGHNPGQNYVISYTLYGPPGNAFICFHDDTFAFDCTTGPNDDFPGGFPRIYAAIPFADSAPLQWTPLGGGTHFSEVDEIPPDDATSFNSSSTIGQNDQYSYNPTGVPAGAQILAVQHNLDMRVDSGARSVASAVSGHIATGVAITNNFHDYTTPYDLNPNTGLPWDPIADFPTSFGPAVTA